MYECLVKWIILFVGLFVTTVASGQDWIWVEGEAAVAREVTANSWYQAVPAGAFSQRQALAHLDDSQPGTATYQLEVGTSGEYALWLRANPHESRISCQINASPWRELPFRQVVQKFPLAGWDLRFMAWIQAGTVSLVAGRNELRFRFEGTSKQHGMLDCFVLTRTPFVPYGIAKPDQSWQLRQQRSADEANWFPFTPSIYTKMTRSAIDLRWMNEEYAGEHGRIVAREGRFVHERTGEPIRFWAVNGPPSDLNRRALRESARLLARYGVNLLRFHDRVFDEHTGEFDPASAQRIAWVVEAMKSEGIYTHLSIYFPLWFRPKPDLDWLPGYNGQQHPFAALMFNRRFQQQYERWWQGVLNTKLASGGTLLEDPAVLGVEIQNEDSFFFWTFNQDNLPDAQLRILEKQFADWLARKYGTVEQAFVAWDAPRLDRDHADEGRVAFRSLWEIFHFKTSRDKDTAVFLYETQRAFYEQETRFLRDLGFRGLVTCSNWTTASPEILGPLEKLSYAPGDFIDRHGYWGCRNGGLFAEWSIREDHTYLDRSALRCDSDDPGQPKQFDHPVIDVQYDDKPSMISEVAWNRPNRYRSEAPLFLAVYGGLQDTDAIVHFAWDGASWSVKPQHFMQPWTLMSPTQFGQFPAAAMIYRRQLVQTGKPLSPPCAACGRLAESGRYRIAPGRRF